MLISYTSREVAAVMNPPQPGTPLCRERRPPKAIEGPHVEKRNLISEVRRCALKTDYGYLREITRVLLYWRVHLIRKTKTKTARKEAAPASTCQGPMGGPPLKPLLQLRLHNDAGASVGPCR